MFGLSLTDLAKTIEVIRTAVIMALHDIIVSAFMMKHQFAFTVGTAMGDLIMVCVLQCERVRANTADVLDVGVLLDVCVWGTTPQTDAS